MVKSSLKLQLDDPAEKVQLFNIFKVFAVICKNSCFFGLLAGVARPKLVISCTFLAWPDLCEQRACRALQTSSSMTVSSQPAACKSKMSAWIIGSGTCDWSSNVSLLSLSSHRLGHPRQFPPLRADVLLRFEVVVFKIKIKNATSA